MKGKRVAVGLSGGVDSAVTALLLKKKGYEVVGVHLYCWPPKSEIEKDGLEREEWIKKNGCRADEDRKMALKTALEIKIPFKVLDFSEEYKERVIDYFYDEYEKGKTPNPDVLCNSEIKFGLFLEWALKNNFDYVATGHYAKLEENGFEVKGKDQVKLFIPKDGHKDQTYFLWKLGQKELGHTIFPLGDYTKKEVREMAKKEGLSVFARPDSQGICFIGKVKVRDFLKKRLKEKKGEVVNIKGEVIGEHDGVWFYTIGQRGGWRLTAKTKLEKKGEDRKPLYIVGKDVDKNELVVGEDIEARQKAFFVGSINWISGKGSKEVINLISRLRIRHGGELIGVKESEISKDGRMEIEMIEEQRGVAPGQSAVFYSSKGECLGGGVIS
jgi:tRNA-uridine 2-sulfurtransferase